MTYFNNRPPKERQYRHQAPDEEIIRWHIEYYQQGETLKQIGKRFGYTRWEVSKAFKRLNLPIARKIEHRQYTPPDDDVIPSEARNP